MSAQEKSTKGIKSTKSIKRGFTLIELMVAIAIIAVLAAVGLVVYSTAQKSARISKRVQDLNAIKTSLELFRSTTGFYPNVTTAGTFVCLDSLTGVNSLVPTYMPQVPRDPLQSAVSGTNCYQYTSDVGGGGPTATVYKVRTHTNISASAEMGQTDFVQQPALIDPNKDATVGDGCVVQLTGITGWAIYSSTTAACNY